MDFRAHRSRVAGTLVVMALLVYGGCGPDWDSDNRNEDRPTLTVEITSGPSSPSSPNVQIDFRCNLEEGCEFECKRNDEDFASCDSPVVYGEMNDGDHVFSVVAFDERGVKSEPDTWAWTVDTTPPEVIDLEGPAEVTAETSATFTFGCSLEFCEFYCHLEGAEQGPMGDAEYCESGVEYVDLADDHYTLTISAMVAGIPDSSESTWSWTVATE